MKNFILSMALLLTSMSMVLSQTNITVSGTISDSVQMIKIANHPVHLFSDSIYDPKTQSYWHIRALTKTDSNGKYQFNVKIPQNVTQLGFTLITTDCTYQGLTQHFTYPSNAYVFDFYICSVQKPQCRAFFQIMPDTQPLTFRFMNLSSQNLSHFNWNFGDQTYSKTKNPVHTYKTHGKYKVVLHAFDSVSKCKDSFAVLFSTYPPNLCNARFFIMHDPKDPYTVIVGNDSTYSNFGLQHYWSFGDGFKSTKANVKHQYKDTGLYKICHIIVDTSIPCSDTFCQLVKIPYVKPCFSHFHVKTHGDTAFFMANPTHLKDARYYWDFGDGTTKTDTTNFTHHLYKQKKIYKVCLKIANTTQNCKVYCTPVNMDSNTNYGFIGGLVLTGKKPADDASIYLIKYNPKDSTLKALDSFKLDSGYYFFRNLLYGKYLVKAALNTNSAVYKNYLPTYHDTALLWSNAKQVVLNHMNIQITRNIYMIAGNNPGGPGFIGGKVTKGANFRTGYMKNIEIVLLDAFDRPVAYEYTNSKGEFEFSNIALGDYKVYADILGKTCYPANATLTTEKTDVSNITFTVNDKDIVASLDKVLSGNIESISDPYPNPATNSINIRIHAVKSSELFINITNNLGQTVLEKTQITQPGLNMLDLQVSHLADGTYFIKIFDKDQSSVVKQFIKHSR